MTTIPASQVVNVIPNVLSAGGNALAIIGLVVTQNTRVPIGTVQPFSTATAVSNFFGATAHEAAMANVYFNGFNNASAVPGSMLFAQMPCTAVAAYIRGGPQAALLSIPQVQAINGAFSVVVDGYTRSATLNLAAATSYSAAAALIASGLNAAPPTVAQATTSTIVGQTASFVGTISGNVLTISQMLGGTVVAGGLLSGSGVISGTTVTGQLTINGVNAGQLGTYAVSNSMALNNVSMTETYGLLTANVIASGTISVGQTVTGTGVGGSTQVTQLGTGLGLTGTYYVNTNNSTVSTTLTFQPTPVTATFDSVSGGFVITSGVVGAASTVAYATGPAAISLFFTQATSAVLSQGSAPLTPGAFMASVVNVTDNWATFMLAFDPDGGNVAAGPLGSSKLAFALWTSQAPQNQNFAFICWDTDPGPTLTVPDTSCLGAALAAGNYTGTCLIYQPTDQLLEAFISGAAAAINFGQTNGRITFAFKGQSGLTASVTSAQTASNLIANGYNFYGAYATAAQNFIFFYPGSVSGPFRWLDSYVNQIWLNAGFQLALMELLTQVNSIPYNPQGFALIEAALADQIAAGLNFGAFRAGVVLSSLQIAEVNSSAGLNISTILNQRGWYLQVQDPGTIVREARGSPICNFWYMDGESVQQITLTSVDLL